MSSGSSTNAAIAAVAGAAALAAVLASRHASSSPATAYVQPNSRPVSASSIRYSSKVSPDMADEHGRVYGGELLKLVDVAAGTVAAKHAGGPCVTVSVDRVIFLQEINVSDVVHLSVAVNRAWGSSMEIGVRVTRETPQSRAEEYCCHAYLTFVKRASVVPPLNLLQQFGIVRAPKPIKGKVPLVVPKTTLQQKRYLLAGRRRAHRITGAEEQGKLLKAFREQLLGIERESLEAEEREEERKQETENLLGKLEQEMLVEAYLKGDKDVRVDGEWVTASIEGFMEPVRMPLSQIKQASTARGHGGYRRLSVGRHLSTELPSIRHGSESDRSAEDLSPIDVGDTLVMSLWIVRPQHCNSKSILFGGTLMRWVEETSSIAARRVRYGPWSSAAIDSLTFKSAVFPGEVVYVRACVIKVWDSSVECYALAMAEDRNSPVPTTRLVSESFFTLVSIDVQSGRPAKRGLRPVRPAPGPGEDVVKGANARREDRLLDKKILQRVYA